MYSICKRYKNLNLTEAGMHYAVRRDALSPDMVEKLEVEGYDFYSDGLANVWSPDFDQMDIPFDAVLWGACYHDDVTQEEVFQDIIKPADHYLVFADSCTWNKASGYKFVDDIKDAFDRNHEANITPIRVSKGGKTLTCRESSHDVPMGSTTYVIALTNREYEKLRLAEFEDVKKFTEIHAHAA